jgi:hypothetical protein
MDLNRKAEQQEKQKNLKRQQQAEKQRLIEE